MGCVYFSIPIVFGYYLFDYQTTLANERAVELKKHLTVSDGVKEQNKLLQQSLNEIKCNNSIYSSDKK